MSRLPSIATEADGSTILAGLEAQPGGRELLQMGAEGADVALVGGAVRDLLLGSSPRELDVVVADDAAAFAAELAARVSSAVGDSAEVAVHERFNTAVVQWPAGRIDVAERRAESYPAPGALPEVRPGSLEDDLARRDFTVNAIAVPLGGADRGAVLCAEHALEDLRAARLRVLHEGSFRDDPTRLLRLARYRTRLGFEIEPDTARLATAALDGGALDTVSRPRLGAELRLALGEVDPVAPFACLRDLGALVEIDARLKLDEQLTRRALALLPSDGHPEVLVMASLLHAAAAVTAGTVAGTESEGGIAALLDALEFIAAVRERILASASGMQGLATAIARTARPSELHALLCAHTPEAIALGAAAVRGPDANTVELRVREWFDTLRAVRLQITGQDLIDAGIAPGPELGARLAAALAARLDGELADGPAAELDVALRDLT